MGRRCRRFSVKPTSGAGAHGLGKQRSGSKRRETPTATGVPPPATIGPHQVRSDDIHVDDEEAFVAIADTWVRKKVTLIGRNGILAAVSSAEIRRAALEFGIEVQTVQANGRKAVTLPGVKAELKALLKFLDEDYYRSPLQGRNYVTNSKRPV